MGSKVINREVIDGHMTVTQTRRTKNDGLHVESLVYWGDKEEGRPVAEWVMPIQLRYTLSDAAHLAVAQTDLTKDVHTEHCCTRHGCKYGDSDCPVEKGRKGQSFPCEACEAEL